MRIMEDQMENQLENEMETGLLRAYKRRKHGKGKHSSIRCRGATIGMSSLNPKPIMGYIETTRRMLHFLMTSIEAGRPRHTES